MITGWIDVVNASARNFVYLIQCNIHHSPGVDCNVGGSGCFALSDIPRGNQGAH